MVVTKDREVNPSNNNWRPVGGFTELAGVILLGTLVLLIPHFCLAFIPTTLPPVFSCLLLGLADVSCLRPQILLTACTLPSYISSLSSPSFNWASSLLPPSPTAPL